jgi:hypothetical protein
MARKRAAPKTPGLRASLKTSLASRKKSAAKRPASIKTAAVKRKSAPKKRGTSDSEASRAKRRSSARQRKAQLGAQGAGLPLSQFGG